MPSATFSLCRTCYTALMAAAYQERIANLDGPRPRERCVQGLDLVMPLIWSDAPERVYIARHLCDEEMTYNYDRCLCIFADLMDEFHREKEGEKE